MENRLELTQWRFYGMSRLLTPPHGVDIGTVVIHPVAIPIEPPVKVYSDLMLLDVVHGGHPNELGHPFVHAFQSHASFKTAAGALLEGSHWSRHGLGHLQVDLPCE